MYAFEAGRRAIEGNLERTGTKGTVEHTPDFGFYRVKYPVQGEPLVSIIIPNREEKETLKECLESIFEKTSYKNYEIIIVENNSSSDEIFNYYRQLSGDPKIHLIRWKKEFNYSAINNFGVRNAKGDYLLFLNNDVKVIDPDWLTEMLGVCQRREVGAVGAKLLYPDNTIQHAGCVIGIGGIAGNMFVNMPAERTGYLHKASILQDMSCVTAACMMMKKSVFQEAGGFTEELAVAFNDIDFCMKLRAAGYLIVCEAVPLRIQITRYRGQRGEGPPFSDGNRVYALSLAGYPEKRRSLLQQKSFPDEMELFPEAASGNGKEEGINKCRKYR